LFQVTYIPQHIIVAGVVGYDTVNCVGPGEATDLNTCAGGEEWLLRARLEMKGYRVFCAGFKLFPVGGVKDHLQRENLILVVHIVQVVLPFLFLDYLELLQVFG